MFFKTHITISSDLKRSHPFLLPVIIAVSLLFTGCGGNSTGPGYNNGGNNNGNGGDPPGANTVQMVGQSFSPTNLEVEVGTTVTWENESSEIHTVTSGANREHDGNFDSGNIAPGETYTYTFNETGEFPYFCMPHPGMEGTITVIDD